MLVVSLQVRPAFATPPACDSPIYTSITLDGNMSCPGTNGLIIAANGVTVNLNSHTISGSGSGNLGISDTDSAASPSSGRARSRASHTVSI